MKGEEGSQFSAGIKAPVSLSLLHSTLTTPPASELPVFSSVLVLSGNSSLSSRLSCLTALFNSDLDQGGHLRLHCTLQGTQQEGWWPLPQVAARTHAEVLEGTFRGRFTHENDGWGSSGEPQGKRASWGRGWEWRQAGLGAEEKLPG